MKIDFCLNVQTQTFYLDGFLLEQYFVWIMKRLLLQNLGHPIIHFNGQKTWVLTNIPSMTKRVNVDFVTKSTPAIVNSAQFWNFKLIECSIVNHNFWFLSKKKKYYSALHKAQYVSRVVNQGYLTYNICKDYRSW